MADNEHAGATEFTGERVIPGLVNDDLWSEHLARYAFARRLAKGRRVLDAGSGTGYGAAEMALEAADVTGIDIAPDAVAYAKKHFPLANLRFVAGSCLALPFAGESFGLIAAFEVIEHLAEYRTFLAECARTLRRDGLFVVSTPNKTYYSETRAEAGANVYHEHEFEAEEFGAELRRVFPHVAVLMQNRAEAFAFHPEKAFWPADGRIDGSNGNAQDAHFFLAVCSHEPVFEERSFVYVPRAANMLRERERHVIAVERRLAAAREALRVQKGELEEHNRWAVSLDAELKSAREHIERQERLTAEMAAGYARAIERLESENVQKTQWARDTETRLTKEILATREQLAECARLLDAAEALVVERTHWAQNEAARREEAEAVLEMVRQSRWVKFGRRLGAGPALERP